MTAVVLIVAVPELNVPVPILALLPVAIFNLLPAATSAASPSIDSLDDGVLVPMPTLPEPTVLPVPNPPVA